MWKRWKPSSVTRAFNLQRRLDPGIFAADDEYDPDGPGGIGAISLLVAALGITNTIMSIYERTREIGVMKVLGCRLKDIRMLFMMEAGAIGLFGGIFGIILSYLISLTINLIAGAIVQSQGAEMATGVSVIPFWLVLLGCGIAILVALAAGSYPARRAMRISALAAIRQE